VDFVLLNRQNVDEKAQDVTGNIFGCEKSPIEF